MRTVRQLPIRSPLAALLAAALLAGGFAPPAAAEAPQVDVARLDYGLKARALADGVWVVEGAVDDFSIANGCNIINLGLIATAEGTLVVNTGTSRLHGQQLRALAEHTTGQRVARVIHLNLHPDYFLGNQGFADVPRLATPTTRAGIAREASAYENNLYRLCGDWMRGTEALGPDADLPLGPDGRGTLTLGGRTFDLTELSGHTDSDLVLVDRASGVAFVGGLVFVQRVPTTPHARVERWLQSLDRLQAMGLRTLVPSHGPVQVGPERAAEGIAQTRRFLQWIDRSFSAWAAQGWDMNEVLRAPVPDEFRQWAAFRTEYVRNVAHLYPVYEQKVLGQARPQARGVR
ncbi:quinoprotein relay system zinc metallohydrolase 1 [Sphaerotilus uruguayifluvii]|uniref:Quinoprotein relay system zinc metallohydrolase 1 n=1 Tax=Sphaerotilus uruguayifluvii TaxID=2735897 RepID=A0ABX2FZY1_9BURK|nr:quinoprotein relay system zinc metallohydrolase 1 [Leptothrix sp. C29]NRT55586.1 quinoprotein relay system zinc metallohydrolase 1 [Leptothrix sp. C29]